MRKTSALRKIDKEKMAQAVQQMVIGQVVKATMKTSAHSLTTCQMQSTLTKGSITPMRAP